MMRPSGPWWIATLGAATLASAIGCNLITGAGDLRASDEEHAARGQGGGPSGPGPIEEGSGAQTSSTTNPAGGSSAAPGSGGSVAGGGSAPNPGPLTYADGVTLTDVDLYQAVRRPLVANGQQAVSDTPVVAGRNALVRVFYTTDGAYDGLPVTARLTVGSEPPVEATQALSGSSSQGALGSTINLDVAGVLLQPGAQFKIELLQPSSTSSGSNAAAAYPSSGNQSSLTVEHGGVKLKIKLVPVDNNGSLPDTSAAQVERYVRWFSEVYPIPEVEITVRAQIHSFDGYLGSYYGWSQLLDQITDLRYQDNAPDDQYYYGIHNANGNGLLGLGWVAGPTDLWARAAIGVGWTGETAAETAIHEIGHNHGREHAPCGVSGDPYYPYSGASIGVWGYSPSAQLLLNPSGTVDFMSYCEPIWISDYTYKALFDRLKLVSTQPMMAVPATLQHRTYDRIKILDGKARWKDVVTLRAPPGGQPRAVELSRSTATRHRSTGTYFAYDHLPGGMLFVRRPRGMGAKGAATWIRFNAEGKTFTLAR